MVHIFISTMSKEIQCKNRTCDDFLTKAYEVIHFILVLYKLTRIMYFEINANYSKVILIHCKLHFIVKILFKVHVSLCCKFYNIHRPLYVCEDAGSPVFY